MRSAITTDRLSKRYDRIAAVDGLSFEVPEGALVGFVGPNGSGKSTTIRMLTGLIQPTGGTGTVLGQPLNRPDKYLPHVGALIESPAFYPELSGRRNLQVLATLGRDGRERIDGLLERVGLTARSDDPVSNYSLGMKQRLGIATALLTNPRLLLLDEPVNGLDPAGIREVRRLLTDIRDEGRTVFVSSHLLSELELVCDWFVIIKEGRLVFQGTLNELRSRQGTRLVATPDRPEGIETIAAIAAAAGFEVVSFNGKVTVDAPYEFAGTLNRTAMDAGVTLIELRREGTSLEDTVLEMTNAKEEN